MPHSKESTKDSSETAEDQSAMTPTLNATEPSKRESSPSKKEQPKSDVVILAYLNTYTSLFLFHPLIKNINSHILLKLANETQGLN